LPHAQGSVGLLLCREFFKQIAARVPNARIIGLHHSKPVGLIWRRLGAASLEGSNMTLRALVSPAALVGDKFSLGPMARTLLGLPPIEAFLGYLLAQRGQGGWIKSLSVPDIEFDLSDELDSGLAGSNLLSCQGSSARIGVQRDYAYLKWRYCDHPESDYRFVTLRRQAKMVGLLVFGLGHGGSSRLYDVMHTQDSSHDAAGVAGVAMAAARHIGIGIMTTKMLEPAIAAAIEAAGAITERKDYDQFWYTGERARELTPFYSYGDFSED